MNACVAAEGKQFSHLLDRPPALPASEDLVAEGAVAEGDRHNDVGNDEESAAPSDEDLQGK